MELLTANERRSGNWADGDGLHARDFSVIGIPGPKYITSHNNLAALSLVRGRDNPWLMKFLELQLTSHVCHEKRARAEPDEAALMARVRKWEPAK